MSEYYTGSGRVPPDLLDSQDSGSRRGDDRRERRASPERRSREEVGREVDRGLGRRDDSERSRESGYSSRDSSSRQRGRSRSRDRDRDPREASRDASRDARGDRDRGDYGRDSRRRYRDLDDEGRGEERGYASGRRDDGHWGGGGDSSRSRDSVDYRDAREREPPREERRRHDDPPPNGDPSQTLVVRGLHRSITEDEICRELSLYGSVSQIRMARDRDTGQHKGVAFIDFSSLEGAINAIEGLRGYLTVQGQEARIEYSREVRGAGRTGAMDWICHACKTVNFGRRHNCFKCSLEKGPHAVEVPFSSSHDASSLSSGDNDIVLLRGLGLLSTDESVTAALLPYAPSGFKLVRVIRDHATNQSRGICFVDRGSVRESSALILATRGIVIDGNQVCMAFARPKEIAAAMGSGGGAVLKGGNTLGQMAIDQAMSHLTSRPVPANVPEGFVWDERSGWYYHSTTGYYFDAATNLYFEPTQKKYYVYDHSTGAYVEKVSEVSSAWTDEEAKPVQSEAQSAAEQAAAQAAAAMAGFGKKKKKANAIKPSTGQQGTSITAMKIDLSTDLQKWKAGQAEMVAAREAVENERPSERVAIVKHATAAVSVPSAEVRLTGGGARAALPEAEAGGWSGPPQDAAAPAAGEGAVCLLCRRKFASAEQLAKHETQSEMHRQKVEEARKAEIARIRSDVKQAERSQEKKVEKILKGHDYAQRARDDKEKAEAMRDAEEAVRAGKDPLKKDAGPAADNRGTEMLMKMGWTAGQGLGASSQGITSHVGVVQREVRAGIGCGEVTREEDMISEGDSYKTKLYKKASSRMNKVDDDPTTWRQNYSQP